MLTQEQVRSEFSYTDGKLYRGGKLAGYTNKNGYAYISMYGTEYARSLLVWVYHYGEIPEGPLWHLDKIASNDRIANLWDSTIPRGEITQERLKASFVHDELTGELVRIVALGDKEVVAGTESTSGYIRIWFEGKPYPRSHLVWLYYTGSLPTKFLDHIDRDRQNDRYSNLREVSHIENCKNKTKNSNNKSGMSGVSWHKKAGKWRAFITIDAKQIHLGLFEDLNDAIEARLEANATYGFSDTHGT